MESDEELALSDEGESDHDEAFSPLMEHFEKLATPSKIIMSRSRMDSVGDEQTTNGEQSSGNNPNKPFIPGHRASISAKFLSRSQKSSSR